MNQFNYFSEIEDTFIRRRGRHLFLSPRDWALMDDWQKKGIPLHIAIRAIENVFDKTTNIGSLAYCAPAVESDYTEWLTSQVGASDAETEAAPANYDYICVCGKQYCLQIHKDYFFSQ